MGRRGVPFVPKYLLDSIVVDPATSARMRQVRRADTDAERVVRALATKVGLRYRVRNPDLPGSPDLANRSRRWAVFVHGCFWHAHARCRAAKVPRRNRPYWTAKFAANKARDVRVLRELHDLGFRAAVVWECEAMNSPRTVESTLRALSKLAPRRWTLAVRDRARPVPNPRGRHSTPGRA